MDESTKEDLSFEHRDIPETTKTKSKDYGNKYMIGRRNLNIKDEHIEQLDSIRKKIGCRSYDNVIKHLCELEKLVDPVFRPNYECKTCHEKVILPINVNADKLITMHVHRDLCTSTTCKGYITTKSEIALDEHGVVLGAKNIGDFTKRVAEWRKKKLGHKDQIDTNNEQKDQIDTNDEHEQSKETDI